MKKLYFLSAVLAAGLLSASCSSDDKLVEEVAAEPQAEDVAQKYPNGEAYINLSLNLPATLNTRADATQNDQFDDGDAQDYAVSEAVLVLFQGAATDPDNATYVGVYDLNLAWQDETSSNQITSVAPIVQKVAAPANDTNSFYAYVVLNNSTATKNALAGKTVGITKFAEVFGTSLKLDPATNRTLAVDGSTTFIPMTNAPLAKYPGQGSAPTDATYSVLSELDKNMIFATKGEAAANPATKVFVERAYAKVTLSTSQNEIKKTDGTSTSVSFTVQKWTLDRTAKESYFQRNVADLATWYNHYSNLSSPTDAYRFVGSSAVDGKYRIYWATDPSYTSTEATAAASFTTAATTDQSDWTSAGTSNPLYCYENTFDVTNQIETATTRALICLQFNSGFPFFTINDDYTNLYKSTTADGGTAATTALKTKIIELLMANPTIKSEANAASVTTPTVAASTITLTTTDAAKVTVSVTNLSDGTYTYTLTSADQAIVTAMFEGTATPATEPSHHIKYYADGNAYYPILIKHFGDSDTPWNAGDHVTGGAYDDNGTAPIDRYLGRYGIVRNNSYILNVNKVTGIGSPTIPTPTDTTDDTAKSYIGVEINILSWAKRTQDVTL